MLTNPQLDKKFFIFSEEGRYPYFTRTVYNNGILGYVNYLDDEHKISGGCLAVGMLGMRFFYMENDFYSGQFTKRVIPKGFKLNQRRAIYFAGLLNKFEPIFQNVLVRNFENTFTSQKVSLPVKNGKIDFEFIESFVAELEAAHLAELEAYLEVTGLNNYELSVEEKEAIAKFNDINWHSFVMRENFNKVQVKKALKKDVSKCKNEEYSTPVVYCKFGDNGIMYWAKDGKAQTQENIISVIYNGAIAAGKVYAQKDPTGILAESYFISHTQNPGNHNINLFFSSCLEKVLYPKYSRDYLATWKNRVENELILLPVKLNGEIDYEKILLLISAVKKLIIKDVVEFSRRKTKATQQVIENNSAS